MLERTHAENDSSKLEKDVDRNFGEQTADVHNELKYPNKDREPVYRVTEENGRKRFRTIKELYGTQYKPVEWIVTGILPNESLISLQGRPKCGKSTFVFAMLRVLVEGGQFLESPVRPIRVVYLSEQNRVSFCQQVSESGIDVETENMSVMTVEDLFPSNWKMNFDAAERHMLETGAKLLVVDSWGKFANFSQHEDEYQSGPTQERVSKLREIISITGATVLVIHHTGKQQGRNLIDAGLGATALAAQVDQAFSLSGEPQKQAALSENMHTEQCRKLQSVGRFTEAITDIQVERQADGTYRQPSMAKIDSTRTGLVLAQSPETIIREAYSKNPRLARYGNQKLSDAIRSEMGVSLSERKIKRCREQHYDLRRRE